MKTIFQKGEKMLKRFVEVVKVNKTVILEKAVIVAGAVLGLLVVGAVLSMHEKSMEGGVEDLGNETIVSE